MGNGLSYLPAMLLVFTALLRATERDREGERREFGGGGGKRDKNHLQEV